MLCVLQHGDWKRSVLPPRKNFVSPGFFVHFVSKLTPQVRLLRSSAYETAGMHTHTHTHTHTHEQQKHTLYSMANTFCSRDQLAPIILLLMPFLSHSSIVVLSYSLLGKHHSFRSFPFILTLGVKNARSGHLFNFVNSINIQYFLRNGF